MEFCRKNGIFSKWIRIKWDLLEAIVFESFCANKSSEGQMYYKYLELLKWYVGKIILMMSMLVEHTVGESNEKDKVVLSILFFIFK